MPVFITDITLSRIHHSWLVTQIQNPEFIAIAELLEQIGFSSLEIWDEATFEPYLQLLNIDPWKRLQDVRQKVKKTRLQVSLPYLDQVRYAGFSGKSLPESIRKLAQNGIDIFRIYDRSNSIVNLEASILTAKQCNAQVQGGIFYHSDSVHNIPDLAKSLENSGCDSICLLDMTGSITPAEAFKLIDNMQTRSRIPVGLCTRSPEVLAHMSYYAAASAGASSLDTNFSAFSNQGSCPLIENIVTGLKKTPFDTCLDEELVLKASEQLSGLLEKQKLLNRNPSSKHPGMSYYTLPEELFSKLIGQLNQPTVSQSTPPVQARENVLKEYSVELDGEVFNIKISPLASQTIETEKPTQINEDVQIQGGVRSIMPGVVLSINVKVGDSVNEGDLLVSVEAMKMRYDIYASEAGRVKAILAQEGDNVSTENVLLIIEPNP